MQRILIRYQTYDFVDMFQFCRKHRFVATTTSALFVGLRQKWTIPLLIYIPFVVILIEDND